MNDFEDASQWMDIRRFDCASINSGWQWTGNINSAVYRSWYIQQGCNIPKRPEWQEMVTRTGDEAINSFALPAASELQAYQLAGVDLTCVPDGYPANGIHILSDESGYIIKSKRHETIFLQIDLAASDDLILKQAKKIIQDRRSKKINKPRRNYLKQLKDNQVVPYIYLISRYGLTSLTQEQIASIIFPDDRYDGIDIVDKLRRSTILLANRYIHIDQGKVVRTTAELYQLHFFHS